MKTEYLFVLRVIKYSEADLIVSGLNAMGAKVPLFAKFALKSRQRFGGGVLQPTHYIKATYSHTSKSFRGPNSIFKDTAKHPLKNHDTTQPSQRLHYLQEATLQNDFCKIRNNYERLQLGLYMLQLVDQFCQEGLLDNAQVFHLLGNALKALEISQDLELLRMVFELRLLKLQGILEEDDLMKNLLCHPISEHTRLKLEPYIELHIKNIIKRHFQDYLFSSK